MAKGKYEYWLSGDGLLLLTAWARDGMTDDQVAKKIGINTATLYVWKKKYSEICEALKRGKEPVDVEVENALLKRALGYSYSETTRELKGGELVTTKVVQKEVVPDVTAQIIWLKNRKPDAWRDRPEDNKDEAETAININILPASMASKEEIAD